MLARISFERIRPLEPIWPSDPHLPPIIRLRPDNRDPPLARPVTEDVFNKRNNSRPHYGIARILHVYRHGHTAAVYAFHCTNLRELTEEGFRRNFTPKEVSRHRKGGYEETADERDKRSTRARTPDPPTRA
jgi:hypothetical protein